MNYDTSKDQKNAEKLIQLISLHLTETNKMLEILQHENNALEKNNLSEFEATLQQKQLQARKLKEMESNLISAESIINAPLSKMAVDSFISKTNKKSKQNQLSSLWEKLQIVLNKCDEQNKINNRVLEASRISLQQAIDILHGGNSSPNLYQSSGKEDRNGKGQSLAVA